MSDGGADFRTFGEFTETYLDLRFGDREIKPGYEELKRLLDKLKKEIK